MPQPDKPGRKSSSEEVAPDRTLDERLDQALKETFPASDPIAVTPRKRPRGPQRKPSPPTND